MHAECLRYWYYDHDDDDDDEDGDDDVDMMLRNERTQYLIP